MDKKELLAREVQLAAQHYPDGLERVLNAIKENSLIAEPYVDEYGCGCFYGHLTGLNRRKASRIANLVGIELKGGSSCDAYTPIERLLCNADREGTLDDAIKMMEEAIVSHLNK